MSGASPRGLPGINFADYFLNSTQLVPTGQNGASFTLQDTDTTSAYDLNNQLSGLGLYRHVREGIARASHIQLTPQREWRS